MRFDVLSAILLDLFFVSTPIGYYVVGKRVCKKCPISLFNRINLVYMIDMYILDFD